MHQVDPHSYDNELAPVEIESGPAGFKVTTSRVIPSLRLIRQITAAALVRVLHLHPNYRTEGGVTGTIQQDDHDEPVPVELGWAGDDYTIFLMSDSVMNPLPGDKIVGDRLYQLFTQALFGLARDGEGYPLILSSTDGLLVIHILCEAVRLTFGDDAYAKLSLYLATPESRNLPRL